ncbi:MAG: endonuclease III [Leptospiraceae bacterium]|nr:endonuclease III [Leptospiraceae bacterium]MDW8305537.1 endonuclease III [Leptospiraceae bacterium]
MTTKNSTKIKTIDPHELYRLLKKHYGIPKPPLKFRNPEELAIAVILSAQCTDERVNAVTPELFRRFPDMKALAQASIEEVEQLIYSTGFYRNKARNIVRLAQIVVENYNGHIPPDFEVLQKLPGIGRKSANVIMNMAFQKAPGIVVDTHVLRLSRRFGYSEGKNPRKTERELMQIIPKRYWLNFSLYLIYHGRKYCRARKPLCSECFLNKICPAAMR